MESIYPYNPSLVTTNEVARDDDIQRIQQICVGYTQDLDRMNAQIKRLQTSLDAITQKRDELQSKVSSLRSIASPLRMFPAEVLQLIFRNCVKPLPTILTDEAPMLLTRICSRWRSIAIDTPELWAAFHIVIPEAAHSFDPYSSRCNLLREGVQLFLSRSCSTPLSISIYSRNMNLVQPDDLEVARTVEILLPHHKRWKYINLRVPYASVAALQDLRGEDLPSLETIHYALMGYHARVPLNGPPPFFDNAPHLHQLSLGFFADKFDMKAMSAESWARLTKLVIGRDCWGMRGIEAVIELLAMCLNVRECSLSCGFGDLFGSRPSTRDKVTLAKLRKLTFISPPPFATTLFNLLYLPELQDLTIQVDFSREDQSLFPSLEELFLRSSCPLTRLKLKGYPKTKVNSSLESMISLFRSVPTLTELFFSDTPLMSDELLKAFTITSPISDVLCPNLTRLEIIDHYVFTEQTLLDFLSARLSPPDPSLVVPLAHVLITDARSQLSSRASHFGESVQLQESLFNGQSQWTGVPPSRELKDVDVYQWY